MIRGIYSMSADEVRLKLFYRRHGDGLLLGEWAAADRWIVESTFTPRTLLLGVDAEYQTRQRFKSDMRGDLRFVSITGGLFRDEVAEQIDFDIPIPRLAEGYDFGVFWTMAAGFGEGFKSRLTPDVAIDKSLARFLHEAPILQDDGPDVVFYRNFLDDESCVRMRPEIWHRIADSLSAEFSVPFVKVHAVTFEGETSELSPMLRWDKR